MVKNSTFRQRKRARPLPHCCTGPSSGKKMEAHTSIVQTSAGGTQGRRINKTSRGRSAHTTNDDVC